MENVKSNNIAIHYLGVAFILFIIGIFTYLNSQNGFKTNVNVSSKKIEVSTENTNSNN